jgi:hypothetical protein
MKQQRSTIMLIVLALAVAIGLPYYFSSHKADALDVKTAKLKVEEKAFKDKSTAGAKIRKQSEEWNKTKDALTAAMPSDPDVQGAIRSLQALTDGDVAPDHVRWVQGSISNLVKAKAAAPAPAVKAADGEAAKTPATTVKKATTDDSTPIPSGGFDIGITVEGSRAKVLAFVTKMQQKPEQAARLFSVRSVVLTVQTSPNGAATTSTTVAAAGSSTEGSVMVKAVISLKVTTFGATPEAPATSANTQVAAGPAPTIVEAPATTAVTTVAPNP